MSLTAEEYYELIEIDEDFKELKLLESYDDFWQFCLYMDYEFFNKRKDILEQIARSMQRLIKPRIPEKELDILNISVPPRTGKSYLCTLFCTWSLGHYPTESIMRNTVTNKLYKKFSRDAIKIMQGRSHRGRYLDVFTNLEFETENIEEGWMLKNSQQGISYYGAGIGGSIIGFGATLLSIVDDSVKGEEEALNENALDKKWRWYGSEVDSREEKGCKKLFIGTRWSKRDIVGRLKEQGFFSGPKAKEIVIPALINGETFCEAVHTTEKYLEKKKLTSDIIWEAEYMQNPVEAKGLLFPESELNRFKIKDLNQKPDGIILAGDIADEGDDSLCCPLGYVYGDKVYIVDVIFTTDPIEVTQPRTAAFINEYQPDKAKFESNNGGKGFAMKVKELIKAKTTVKWEPSTSNKHTRIIMKSGYIKENFYFRKDIKLGSEYDKYMKELNKYNKLGKVVHDDAPDATTMLAEMMDKPNLKPRKRKPGGF